jgi:hypothetical protein
MRNTRQSNYVEAAGNVTADATKGRNHAWAETCSATGIRMLRKSFGSLLFTSLSSEFCLYVQHKILDILLFNGPLLIWVTLGHTIFPSVLLMQKMLKQDLL